ncbi:MAG: nucleotidyl transferase AbiEii/AbiGii toxin family protein [Planctomycetota bacterium]
MIPRANITAWRAVAPWAIDAQVEQDLVISRALVALYSHPSFRDALAFRGGTALHKLLLPTPGRYSEDIDLVQTTPGPIGPALDAIREALDPWLGAPGRKQTEDGATLLYRFESSGLPAQPMRLKVEINTREHDSVDALTRRDFRVANPWFTGSAQVLTYSPTELLGTKLRALYQRKKGRDLFDLCQALTQLPVDDAGIVRVFGTYLERAGLRVTRAQFERNLAQKERMPEFFGDVLPLLPGDGTYEPATALSLVRQRLIELLPGKPWRTKEGPES